MDKGSDSPGDSIPARVEPTRKCYDVRQSDVHGHGAFANRDIARGEVIDEYAGERISHDQADERYASRDVADSHTFLLTLDDDFVIDGSVGGNDARFINHQCDPNCTTVVKDGRMLIVAKRRIRAGQELGFEYNIGREDDDPENVDEIYACHCGSPEMPGHYPVASRAASALTERNLAMEIRDATDTDLPQILAIYNDVITNTTAIYDETLSTLEERRAWFEARKRQGWPVLVAAEGAEVLGFASFGEWRARWGYRYTVEHSVHVRTDCRGQGIGRSLIEALFPLARAKGVHVMIAAIDSQSSASLHPA